MTSWTPGWRAPLDDTGAIGTPLADIAATRMDPETAAPKVAAGVTGNSFSEPQFSHRSI